MKSCRKSHRIFCGKAYPEAVIVDDGNGVFKADGTEITINQTLVDAARVELDKLKYQSIDS